MSVSAEGRWAELFHPRFAATTATLTLGVAVFAFNTFLVSTAMPTAVAELHGAALISWALTLYIVAAIVAGASAAMLKDRFGGRATLVAANLVFVLGTTIAATGGSMPTVLAGRLLQGLGEGTISAICYALIPNLFPTQLVAKVFGAEAIVWAIAAFGGPVLAGYLTETLSWRTAFLFNLPVAALFMALVLKVVPADRRPGRGSRAPLVRLGLVAGGMLAISVAAVTASPAAVIMLLAAAALAFPLAVRMDRRAASPLLPRDAFAWTTLPGAGLWAVLAMPVAQSVTGVFLVFAVQNLWGRGATEAGVIGALLACAWSLSAVVVASYNSALWRIRLIAMGSTTLAAGLGLSTLAIASGLLWLAVAGQIITGMSLGMSWGNLCQTIMEASPQEDRDRASALLPTLQSAGYALGSAVMGLVANLAGFADATTPDALRPSMTAVFAFSSILALGGTLSALRMLRLSRNRLRAAPAVPSPPAA